MLRMGEHMILSMYLFLDRASLTPLSAPREATQRQKFGGTPFPGALIFKGRHKNAGLLAHSTNRVFVVGKIVEKLNISIFFHCTKQVTNLLWFENNYTLTHICTGVDEQGECIPKYQWDWYQHMCWEPNSASLLQKQRCTGIWLKQCHDSCDVVTVSVQWWWWWFWHFTWDFAASMTKWECNWFLLPPRLFSP